MLVRSAHRSTRPNSIISLERIQRPWLRTTYNGTSLLRRDINSRPGLSERPLGHKIEPKDVLDGKHVRTMASQPPMGTHRPGYLSPLDNILFEDMSEVPPPHPGPSASPFRFNPIWNVESSHMFDTALNAAPGTTKLRRTGSLGVGGEFSEIISVFDACLQVGRLERAEKILEKLCNVPGMLDLVDSLGLQLRFVKAAVEQIIESPTTSNRNALHKFFELNVRSTGVPQNIEMVAYMLKAALQGPQVQQIRLVRRYMSMLDEESALEVLNSDILSPAEINRVAVTYPKYSFAQLDGVLEVKEEVLKGEIENNEDHPEINPDVEVLATQQKGLGLRSLKQALAHFSLPGDGIKLSEMGMNMKRDIQKRIEKDSVDAAIRRWREENAHLTKLGMNSALQTKSIGSRMWKWQVGLEELLKAELKKLNESEAAERKTIEDYDRCMYGPLLRVLPPSKLAALTILTTMNKFSGGGNKSVPLSTLVMEVARNVEDENSIDIAAKMAKKNIWPQHMKNRLSPEHLRKLSRRGGSGSISKMMNNIATEFESSAHVPQRWPVTQGARVGAFLVASLIEVAKVPCTLIHADTKEEVYQAQPAFFHSHKNRAGKRIGVVSLNDALVDMLKREPVHALLAKHLPMVVKPDPWIGFSKGGYLVNTTKIMRNKSGDKDQRYYAEAAIGQGNMDKTFKGLDVLGMTPWRINQAVYKVMLEAWNSGDAVANLAPQSPKLETPPEPASTLDPRARSDWIRKVKAVENQLVGLHSQRCSQNFQLEIARALKDEIFYFPHNIDFRGRAYPIPPYLNHMGADHCRGLLMFGDGKPLGRDGLRWLKIHLANVFGFDKASLLEREEFANDNMDKIYNSALNPLNGARWWLEAEDPWQCLATCFELMNALESGDPKNFVSHLPVHQDGTCNGLQHYAALGGDLAGAKQVNLEPGDRPADVYTAVADLVKKSIAEDKANGSEIASHVDGKITRKTVKQTVMTNVYGVTFMGANAQVRKQLSAADFDLPPNLSLDKISTYITGKVFAALGDMFRGAHDIQHWLGDCAEKISRCLTNEQLARLESQWLKVIATPKQKKKGLKTDTKEQTKLEQLSVFKTSVIWTNPINMPVVQPYRTPKSRHVETQMQKITLSEPHFTDPVSRRKQYQGFPPNFIHSLDASHMILSATTSSEKGLTFAAVHDSFWTHAADIDMMNDVLRDSFIRIHSEDIVTRLATEFATRYKGSLFLARVEYGTAVHKKIAVWRTAQATEQKQNIVQNRHTKAGYRMNELLMEYNRQKLLSSSNPDEVEQGKKMATPASLWEQRDDDTGIASDPALKSMMLGSMEKVDIDPLDASEESTESVSEEEDLVEDADGISTMSAETLEDPDLDASTNDLSDPLEGLATNQKPDPLLDERSRFEKVVLEPARKTSKKRYDYIWLPLTFPKVPKRGDFDVSRLRDSKYFFS